MKNKILQKELQEICGKKDAEIVGAKLLYMLNQVAKNVANDDVAFSAEVYALKTKMMRYYENNGFVINRVVDGATTALVSFDIYGIKLKFHEKRYTSVNYMKYAVKLFPYVEKECLSEHIELWLDDRLEMLFALRKIQNLLFLIK